MSHNADLILCCGEMSPKKGILFTRIENVSHFGFSHLEQDVSFLILQHTWFIYIQVLSDEKVLGKFCGQNSTDRFHPGEKPILAPGNRLQLVFLTDDSNQESHLGFTAFYQAVGELQYIHILIINILVLCT